MSTVTQTPNLHLNKIAEGDLNWADAVNLNCDTLDAAILELQTTLEGVPTGLAKVASTGEYADLHGTPALGTASTHSASDFDAAGTAAALVNLIAASQNADWDATSGPSAILNKPVLSTVATSGLFSDLLEIPPQAEADWNATTGPAVILNKPSLGSASTHAASDFDLAGTASSAASVVQANLEAETVRANAAEAAIASALTTEVNRSQTAEALLLTSTIAADTYATQTSLLSEENTRAEADAANTTAISNEVTRAETAEALLAPKSSLSLVATTGSYGDLTGKPSLSFDASGAAAAVQVNLNLESTRAETEEYALSQAISTETSRAQSAEALLATKTSLAKVATSGSYPDLTNLPTLGTASTHAASDFDAAGSATTVQTNLSAETTRAEAAESTLTTAVNGKQSALGFTPENTANKGVANGYASLDSTLHIPINQLPASVQGALSYVGVWNAATNSPAIASGAGTKGNFYKVSVAGSTTVDGNATWHVGDLLIFDGTTWDKIDNYEAVTSVVGQVGAVTLAESDITGLVASLAAKANTASLAPVAISGVYNDLTGKPTLATVAASGSYPDLINKPTLGTAAAMAASAFDAANSAATVQTNLTAEITRAEAAEAGIATSVSDETTRATAAEGLLATIDSPLFNSPVGIDVSSPTAALTLSDEDVIGWISPIVGNSHEMTGGVVDTGISRGGLPGMVCVGNGTSEDASGVLACGVIQAANLAPSATVDTTNAANVTSGTLSLTVVPTIPASKTSGFATVATTGDYSNLSGKPTIPVVGTATPVVDGVATIGSTGKWADSGHIHPTDMSRDAAGAAATVQTNLNTEATTRANADTANATAISNETTRATTAEGLLAPKANPTFTGTVTGITAAMVSALPSSTQLPVTQAATLHKWINSYTSTTGVFTETQPATTDLSDIGTFQLPSSQVTGLPLVSTATPLVNGTAAAGSSGKWADGSHIHPVDTSRQAALGYTPLNPSNNLSDVGAVSTALGNLGGLSSATAASTYAALSGATYTGPVVIPSLSSPTTGTATSSANYNSNTHAFLSSYWTGSAAAVDSWTAGILLNTGSNPASILNFTHAGSTANGYALCVNGTPTSYVGLKASGIVGQGSSIAFTVNSTSLGYFDTPGLYLFKGCFLNNNNNVATSSLNYSAPTLTSVGYFWNGTASAADTWTIQNVLGSGSNPTSVLTISHVGTSGASSVSIAGGVSTPVVTSTVATGTAPFVVASTTPVANLSIPWSGLSGTPSAGFNFSENETPSGLINGVNATYTLAHTPITDSLKLYWNGIRLLQGTHFTLSGSTITMLTGSIPQVNTPVDYLIADYRY